VRKRERERERESYRDKEEEEEVEVSILKIEQAKESHQMLSLFFSHHRHGQRARRADRQAVPLHDRPAPERQQQLGPPRRLEQRSAYARDELGDVGVKWRQLERHFWNRALEREMDWRRSVSRERRLM